MRASWFEWDLSARGYSAFLLAVVLLTVPLTWIISWCISVAIHELGHLLMLWLLGVKIQGIRFGFKGALIYTEPMGNIRELLCALAGPLAGCSLLLLRRWMPLTSLFAFCHTFWNLIPLPGNDGARILGTLWAMVRKIPCKPGQERLQ